MTVITWLLAIGLVGILIGRIRVGVRITAAGKEMTADLKIGFAHIRVYPGKAKDVAEKPEPPKAEKAPAHPRKKPKLRDIRGLLRTMWPPLRKALSKTRRSVRIYPLQLAITVGGEKDPAEAAQLYGELHGAVWTVMPLLEQLLDIRDPHIHVGIDFDTTETSWNGVFGISICIGTLLRIALSLAVPGIRWFLDFQKQQKLVEKQSPASAGSTAQ